MSPTLQQILLLAGRLDDSPGFDTPRERFRRFLTEHVTDLGPARALVDECQQGIGEQQHRARQDLIVLLGRFLGFETAFGPYTGSAGIPKHDGHWRSRRRLYLTLVLRADRAFSHDFDDLARTVGEPAAVASASDPEARRLGLCVIASRHTAGRPPLPPDEEWTRHVRLVSVRSLLLLAEWVSAGRLEHEEVVQLIASGFDIDLVTDLVDRCSSDGNSMSSP